MRRFLAAVIFTALAVASLTISAQQRAQAPAPQRAVRSPTYPRSAAQTTIYFPERFDWQHRRPEEVGMNPALVAEAVQAAVAAEPRGSKVAAEMLKASYGREPMNNPIGPIKDRGGPSGLITRRGYIVAEWGDPGRVDMTFSVTKTFLTTLVGLAWQKGLIRDVNDYARDYMPAGVDLFEAEHNQKIKWDHLLRQTSDWQGTLWDKPDWVDRPEGNDPAAWPNRKLYEPGTHYKYNDVRVNVMALAALQVWRRPLPQVLREEIMEPIGASSTWRWNGYENAWVEIDGQKLLSVSGGGHWGGGMFINSYDLARFGYMFLRNGKWKDKTLVSEKWIQMARTPGPANAGYGYANWYLNPGRKEVPAAPETAVRFVGNGNNIVYIDWDNDIVAVMRWITGPGVNQVVEKTLAALKTTPTTASR